MSRLRNLLSWKSESKARARRERKGPQPNRPCRLEALEPRTLLSAGVVTNSFSGTVDTIKAGLAVGDKFVTVGQSAGDFAIARYNANGTLDAEFGKGGVTITAVNANGSDWASAVAVDSRQGQLVAGGHASEVSYQFSDFALARYKSNGILDTTFGTKGKVKTDFGGNDLLSGVVVLADGRVYAGGTTDVGTPYTNRAALARYTAAGRLDTSFGTGGLVQGSRLSPGTGRLALWNPSGALEPRIVQAGTWYTDTGTDQMVLICYRLDGSLDTQFGAEGRVTSPAEWGSASGQTVAIDNAGNILVAGWVYQGNGDAKFAIARFLPSGAPDTSFGVGGLVETDFAESADGDEVLAIQVDSAGNISAAGYMGYENSNFAVALYNSSGVLQWQHSLAIGKYSRANAVGFLSDRIIVGGQAILPTATSTQTVAALAGYTLTGQPATDFGQGISIGNADVVTEDGDAPVASFPVYLTGSVTYPVIVSYTTIDGTALAERDFTPVSGTLTLTSGDTYEILVPIVGDVAKEATEQFYVRLSNPAGAALANTVGVGTIVDNDMLPGVSISDVSKSEGNRGTTAFVFTVELSSPSGSEIRVVYTNAAGSATPNNDYQPIADGTLIFARGETVKQVTVLVRLF